MNATVLDPAAPQLVYVTVIRTTAARLWEALTQPEFIRQYFFGCNNVSTWQVGDAIESRSPDGDLVWSGSILKCIPEQEAVFTFRHVQGGEEPSTVTYRIGRPEVSAIAADADPADYVQLTVVHEGFPAGSKVREQVSNGWPGIVSGIKSLLETGATEMIAPNCHYGDD